MRVYALPTGDYEDKSVLLCLAETPEQAAEVFGEEERPWILVAECEPGRAIDVWDLPHAFPELYEQTIAEQAERMKEADKRRKEIREARAASRRK